MAMDVATSTFHKDTQHRQPPPSLAAHPAVPCRLLWGIPGRSNALNIAQRLGLEPAVVAAARDKMGSAAAEVGGYCRCCSAVGTCS